MITPDLPQQEKKTKKVEEKKAWEKKDWHPFLVVDHSLRPQTWHNTTC